MRVSVGNAVRIFSSAKILLTAGSGDVCGTAGLSEVGTGVTSLPEVVTMLDGVEDDLNQTYPEGPRHFFANWF